MEGYKDFSSLLELCIGDCVLEIGDCVLEIGYCVLCI